VCVFECIVADHRSRSLALFENVLLVDINEYQRRVDYWKRPLAH